MERIGEFAVMAYHSVNNAAQLHNIFKQKFIEAAVIDAAFIISRLHLAVALHRITHSLFEIESNNNNNNISHSTSKQTARDIFSALSHTRNLDRVLQKLTCVESTRAVVIILIHPTEKEIKEVTNIVQGILFNLSNLKDYCEETAVKDFYGVTSAEASELEVAVVTRLATSDI